MELCKKPKIIEIGQKLSSTEFFTSGHSVSKMENLMAKGAPNRAPQNHHGTVLEHTSELEAHIWRFCCTIVGYLYMEYERITPAQHHHTVHRDFCWCWSIPALLRVTLEEEEREMQQKSDGPYDEV